MRSTLSLVSAAAGLLSVTPAAMAIPFTITVATLTGNSGYGRDAVEDGSSTLLDTAFVNAFTPQTHVLNGVNSQFTFDVATIAFSEPETNKNIDANDGAYSVAKWETDDLGIMASFTVTAPIGTTQTVTASGTAIRGKIGDPEADYVIRWDAPLQVHFGSGGVFSISLSDLSFSGPGTQTETATVTLLAQPAPEPTSLALLGLGLAGLGFSMRRRP